MSPDAEWVRCWRCGKLLRRLEPACPDCLAPRRRSANGAAPPASATTPMARVMTVFGLMLLASVLFGILTSFGIQSGAAPAPSARARLRLMLAFEVVDTALVGAAFLLIGRPVRWPPSSRLPRPWLWLSAVAGIALVVLLNAAYHLALRTYLGVAAQRDAVLAGGLTPLVLFVYCLQPAVVEELFFRCLALDTLRSVMGLHAAVAVSALMFGLAHVGVPLSIPMLGLVGVPLAYARVCSGTLVLPMLLHFLHNWIIVAAS